MKMNACTCHKIVTNIQNGRSDILTYSIWKPILSALRKKITIISRPPRSAHGEWGAGPGGHRRAAGLPAARPGGPGPDVHQQRPTRGRHGQGRHVLQMRTQRTLEQRLRTVSRGLSVAGRCWWEGSVAKFRTLGGKINLTENIYILQKWKLHPLDGIIGFKWPTAWYNGGHRNLVN